MDNNPVLAETSHIRLSVVDLRPEMSMQKRHALANTFRGAAQKVSAVVSDVSTLEQALAYTVELCNRKEACQLLMAGCDAPLSTPADALCGGKQRKRIAAPGLAEHESAILKDLCTVCGIDLVDGSLRQHLAGIDIGFTLADYGIAETGTLVIDSSSETVRLATMISEVHVAALPASRIRATAFELETELQGLMKTAPNFIAFITGASRTADIERVLALGVHGPLELHILIVENA